MRNSKKFQEIALGKLWGRCGEALGSCEEALGSSGEALGSSSGEVLGKLWGEALIKKSIKLANQYH